MADGLWVHTAVRWVHVPPEHPALPGHFPGRPIVPGVVLLDHVLEFLRDVRPGMSVREIPVAKFLRSVLPDETVLLTLDYPAIEDSVSIAFSTRFTCRVGRDLAVQGTLRMSSH